MQFDADMPDLDMIGVLEGTDKSSSVQFGWDYLRHYQTIFAPLRDEAINLIEIGVAHGSSLKVWRSFFSEAHIIGVDIEPNCAQYAAKRITIEIGSQADPEFLAQLYEKYPPTIVIDDGSHLAHHIVFTFEKTFPALPPGGIYIVEDMGFHFGAGKKNWCGDGSADVSDYFSTLAQDRMANGSAAATNLNPSLRIIADEIDEITFIGCAAIIRKRDRRKLDSALAYAERYLAKHSVKWIHYARLGEFVLRHEGPLEYAFELAQKAISLGGAGYNRKMPMPGALLLLVNVLERQGKLDEAAAKAEKSALKYPLQSGLWEALSRVESRRRNFQAAADALKKAVALRPEVPGLRRELSNLLELCEDLPGALAEAIKAAELQAARYPNPELEERVATLRLRLAQTEPVVIVSGESRGIFFFARRSWFGLQRLLRMKKSKTAS